MPFCEGACDVAAQLAGGIPRREVKVARVVHRLRGLGVRKVEVLELGAHVEHEATVLGLLEHTLQAGAGVTVEGLEVRGAHLAEHARDALFLGTPGQDLEGLRNREGQHVGLLRLREAVHRAAVEANALLEGLREVLRRDGERLEVAQHVGKPQAHEADVALLNRAKHEVDVLLVAHRASLPGHRHKMRHGRPRACHTATVTYQCFGAITVFAAMQ